MQGCNTSRAVRGFLPFVFMFGLVLPLRAAITPVLTPSMPSPSVVGAVVTWTVQATDTNPGPFWYRFRASPVNGDFKMVRDFGPSNTLDWTTIESDGIYVIEAAVRNQVTGEIAYTSAPYEMRSRVIGQTPIVSPTANSLVFIYSAPPCAQGGVMQVVFWGADR